MASFDEFAHGFLRPSKTLIGLALRSLLGLNGLVLRGLFALNGLALRGLVALLVTAQIVVHVPLEGLLLFARAGVLVFPSHDKNTQVTCGICGG